MIFNTKTYETKYFTLFNPQFSYRKNITIYKENKIVIVYTAHNEIFVDVFSEIMLLNFETGEHKNIDLKIHLLVYDVKMVNENVIWILTNIGIGVFDLQYFEEQDNIDIKSAHSLLIHEIIIGGHGSIMFWNKRVTINLQPNKTVTLIKLVDNTECILINYKTHSIINRINIEE